MNKSNNSIHIITSLDTNYIQHCGVMLSSLFYNNHQHTFTIWLIIDFKENKEFRKLKSFIHKTKHTLKVVHTDGTQVSHFQTIHHLTSATYYRILIADLIDSSLKKIIYLDVDIIVKNDIADLWNTPFDDMLIAAVPEYGFNRHRELGLEESSNYFNAGVFLINIEKWREKKMTNVVLAFLNQNHASLPMMDQDALNIVLAKEWKELHHKWNVTSNLLSSNNTNLQKKEKEAAENPVIIHYTGFSKPWHYLNTHPLKKEYYKYIALTPWKKFKHPEDTNWHHLKQYIKKILKW